MISQFDEWKESIFREKNDSSVDRCFEIDRDSIVEYKEELDPYFLQDDEEYLLEINQSLSNASVVNDHFIDRNEEIVEGNIIKKNTSIEYSPMEEEEEQIKEEENTNYLHLYHFTDKSNLESIRKYGLLSQQELDERGIQYRSNSNDLSKRLDKIENLQDYIRLCLVKDTPMLYRAIKEGRILNPILLEISVRILHDTKDIKISNMNATDRSQDKKIEKGIQWLQNIKIDILRMHQWNKKRFDSTNKDKREKEDKKYYQAEILIKSEIPKEYIINLDNPLNLKYQ